MNRELVSAETTPTPLSQSATVAGEIMPKSIHINLNIMYISRINIWVSRMYVVKGLKMLKSKTKLKFKKFRNFAYLTRHPDTMRSSALKVSSLVCKVLRRWKSRKRKKTHCKQEKDSREEQKQLMGATGFELEATIFLCLSSTPRTANQQNSSGTRKSKIIKEGRLGSSFVKWGEPKFIT